MNGYRGFRKILFELYFATMPLHAWLIRGRATRRAYLNLKASEFIGAEELRDLQLVRLREILQHAFSTSDYYRKTFLNLGLHPNDISDLNQLSKLPFLSKDDVRENINAGLLSSAISRKHLHKISTSGSTGQPFTIYADREQLEIRFASTLRSLEWTGWRFGDRQARLWHQTIGMKWSQVVREKMDALLMQRLFVPAFEISPDNIEEFINQIRRHNPVLIDGYAESLNFLATYLRQDGSPGFRPAAVMSSAQALPATTRKVIEEGLGTQVFDKYGSREFSGIAYECAAHTYHHVIDECYIVELLVEGRPARPGEIGEVVITDLFNRATPMIRYRIGDLAVAVEQRPCSCGRSHSMIGDIEGRTQAVVHCADGTWLPGTFFAHFFKDYESTIRFFQIEQKHKGVFKLRIVKSATFSSQDMVNIEQKLRRFTGETKIELEFVQSIPLVRTGKRSPVVSTVPIDFQTLSAPPNRPVR
jgi:phenylacetate-CoA ligase